MDLSLNGKRALVCGATQGIGFAAAQELSGLGAEVVLAGRDAGKLKEASAKLTGKSRAREPYIVADFFDPAQVRERAAELLEKTGTIHILINNSGGPSPGPVLSAQPEQFISVFNQHLIANHLLAQLLVPGMKADGYGRIINIISTSVKIPIPGLGVSNTIRGAVANWAKTLSYEVGEFGITVNNVLPGATDTERLRGLFACKAEESGKNSSEIFDETAKGIPLRRIAGAHEVAAAVAFLASPAAGYISGVSLPVDGGRTGCH